MRAASIAVSRDGRLLAAGTYDKSLRIWDVATGTPVGQPITHPDIVNAVEFLISDKASWITGQRFVVDGGQTVH